MTRADCEQDYEIRDGLEEKPVEVRLGGRRRMTTAGLITKHGAMAAYHADTEQLAELQQIVTENYEEPKGAVNKPNCYTKRGMEFDNLD